VISIKLIDNRVLQRMNSAIKDAFTRIKEEMDGHRESINGNSHELNNMHDYLCEIDEKIEKLRCRIDEIQMALESNNIMQTRPKFNNREKDLLLLLYTNEEKHFKLGQLANRLSTTVSALRTYVKNIKEKGIPLVEEIHDDTTYLWLDPDFRERQAKFNILGLSEMAVTVN